MFINWRAYGCSPEKNFLHQMSHALGLNDIGFTAGESLMSYIYLYNSYAGTNESNLYIWVDLRNIEWMYKKYIIKVLIFRI